MIVQWFFATGRDHPIYAITFDLTGVADGAVLADSRVPYGDVQWDGGGGTPVSGVGWGDRYRFESLDSPISMASGWTYETPNRIPYSMMWTTAPDAEMGLVQTETWEQHDAGGFWFYSAWGARDDDGPMPESWNWAYQLNQYELPFPGGDASKRLAWGMNYGAVGQSEYPRHGDDGTASGWPFQSYSVAVVLGTHSSAPVAAQARDIESLVDARITASVGRVRDRGPGGVGRDDEVMRAVPGTTRATRCGMSRPRPTNSPSRSRQQRRCTGRSSWCTAGPPTRRPRCWWAAPPWRRSARSTRPVTPCG